MRTFVMLRHAKSSWDDEDQPDHDRPLAPRGRKAARAMGRALAEMDVRPDLVLCSTAVRAVETWERAAAAFDTPPQIVTERRLYLAGPGRILEVVREVADEEASILVVGHNPGFEVLAQRLATTGPQEDMERLDGKFPTGAAAVFAHDGAWSRLGELPARLVRFLRPRDLED